MIFREDAFSDLQNDLVCPLLADQYFADVGVFDYRKEEIGSLIDMSLGMVTEKQSKIGVCVIAMPLIITDDFREGDSRHPRRVTATYLVLENPLFNMGSNGTKKPALSVCSRLGHVLKHYILGGLATGLVPGEGSYIKPAENPLAPIAYEVSFSCYENIDQIIYKCEMPAFDYDGVTGVLTLSTATADATIYYTLDGGYPHPSNPYGFTVLTYSGPITITGEAFVRAGAFKESHIPSNIAAARFNELGDSLGGILGDESGAAISIS